MPTDNRKKRWKKYLVDPKVQGTLIRRALLYWVCWVLGVAILRIVVVQVSRIFPDVVGEGWLRFAPEVAASLFYGPLISYDILRLSNSFVGPMYRLRRNLIRLGQGENVEPLHFRDGDMWQEFAEAFNEVSARVKRLSEQAAAGAPCGSEQELAEVGAE